MFKTLIATALLSTSVSVNAIKPKQVQPVQAINEVDDNWISVNGWYTFNQIFDYDYDTLPTWPNNISFSLLSTDGYDMTGIIARYGYEDKIELLATEITSISVSISDLVSDFTIKYNVSNGLDNGSYQFSMLFNARNMPIDYSTFFGFGNTALPNSKDPRFIDTETFLKNFMIHFNDTITLFGTDASFFASFFNGRGNSYSKFYNGWYTYNNSNWFNFDYYFEIPYNIYQVNNVIYTSYMHSFDNAYYYYYDSTYPYQHNFTVYAYTEYTRVRPVQIYGLIPYTARECMASEGVFDYIQPQSETTWYQMILSVMDAPIYYLSQLFDFKLFGISMFVALTSLLTLMLVVTLIKKVI